MLLLPQFLSYKRQMYHAIERSMIILTYSVTDKNKNTNTFLTTLRGLTHLILTSTLDLITGGQLSIHQFTPGITLRPHTPLE